jgi:hypothetical protein
MTASTFDCGTNYLEPSGFKVLINRELYPNLQFYAQSVQHPDLSLGQTDVGYPRVGRVAVPGESLEFGQLSMDVLLDENMHSYRELYNWVERIVETKHKLSGDESFYHDITVSVLTSHNNVNRKFKYINCFPVNLGAISFNAQSTGEYVIFPVTFKFDYFEFS